MTSSAEGFTGGNTPTEERVSARNKAVLELLQTETEYCERLQALRESFIRPLRESAALYGPQMRIFDDIEILLRSNQFFLRQLRAR